jgi:hypothetical protein
MAKKQVKPKWTPPWVKKEEGKAAPKATAKKKNTKKK